MGIKISEMTPDASIGGGELIPVSDNGTAKSVTTAGLKSYVVDQIEAIAAGTAVTGADGVYVLQGGVIKPVDIDLVAQHAIDTIWGKAADASPAGTDKIAIKDTGTTENTVTLAVLATYVQTAIRAAVLNPATLDAAGATSGADLFVLGQSGVAKKITLTSINDAIYAGLAAYVTAVTAASSANDADEFYAVTAVGARKVTLAQIKTQLGITNAVTAPGSITESYVPQWGATGKTLLEGVPVKTTIADAGATGSGLPTETAVRNAIDASKISAITEEKATVADSDMLVILDSEAGNSLKLVPKSLFDAETVGGLALGETPTTAYRGDRGLTAYVHSQTSHLALGTTSATAYRGDNGKVAYDHSQAAHAPDSAQKNSDILKSEIEAKLTGEIASHTHAGLEDANDQGTYATGAALAAAVPAGSAGFYARVVSTGTMWLWDPDAGPAAWVDSLLTFDLTLGETAVTAHRGDHGVIAYDHSQAAHADVNVGKFVVIETDPSESHALILTDAGKYIRCGTALEVTLTVPTFTNVAFPAGTIITIEQTGTGAVTVVGAAEGVVIHALDDGFSSAGQYSAMQLINVDEDEWVLLGGIA